VIVPRFALVFGLGAALLLPPATAAHAAVENWSVTSGNWSLGSNWGTTVPGPYDTAYITNGGTATINQSGAVCNYLYLGGADTGAVAMSGGSLGVGAAEYIGATNTGTFAQSGGTNGVTSFLYLGGSSGVAGIYTLSNLGVVSASSEYVGYAGTGTFAQSGGTNSVGLELYLGNAADAPGTYNLSSGLLSAASQYEYVGYLGPGTCNQSGGTNTVFGLYLGYNAGASAKYDLSGSGLLSAVNEYVGYSTAGTLTQTSGLNQATYLSVGSQGRYQLSGGRLQVNSLTNQGVLDGTGGYGLLAAQSGSIVDLSQGSLDNAGSLSLTVGANSLLIVPAGFNPVTSFRSYSNAGLLHAAGTTLTIAAGQGFSGIGALADHVSCQGTISATPGGLINLNDGLSVSATGSVSLGSGSFIVNDIQSGISAGLLSAATGYVGYSGSGSFSQSGGTNALTSGLILGSGTGDLGAYNLSGAAVLSTPSEQVALSGTGTFTQSGGTNNVSGTLYLAQGPAAAATYTLSSSGLLAATTEYICWSGSGALKQSGGTNSVAVALYVGFNSGGNGGTYNLSGTGALSAANEFIGWQCPGVFTQSGGTNTVAGSIYLGYSSTGTYNLNGGVLVVSGIDVSNYGDFNLGGGTLKAGAPFSTSQPLVLSGSGGNGCIDTGDYAVTLSGPLSGPGGLNKLGGGILTLTGSNTYTGGTTISAGMLVATSSSALPDGTSLTVGGTFIFDPSASATPASGAVAVPEPGTLLLLAAGAIGLLGWIVKSEKPPFRWLPRILSCQ